MLFKYCKILLANFSKNFEYFQYLFKYKKISKGFYKLIVTDRKIELAKLMRPTKPCKHPKKRQIKILRKNIISKEASLITHIGFVYITPSLYHIKQNFASHWNQ